MKRDTKTQKKLLKLDRTTVRQLEQKDLERANGGMMMPDQWGSICQSGCSN